MQGLNKPGPVEKSARSDKGNLGPSAFYLVGKPLAGYTSRCPRLRSPMGLSRVRAGAPLACDLLTDSLLFGYARFVAALDPNDLSAPAGFGGQGFITPEQDLPYQINFENLATARAPAETVIITQTLSPNLDSTTFQLGHISFGNTTIHIPPGRNAYSTQIDDRANSGLFVDVSAGIDYAAGVVAWNLHLDRSHDPGQSVRSPRRLPPARYDRARGGGFGVVHNLPQVVSSPAVQS